MFYSEIKKISSLSTRVTQAFIFFLFFILCSSQQSAFANDLAFYKLGVGDTIKIIVHGEDDLTLETTLSDSGNFTYPFLGEVVATGLTVEELTNAIVKGLKPDYLINPNVNIFVVKYRSFFISGEVKQPGSYPYQPELTLRKAVAIAGGFTDRASQTSISVIPEGSSENNKEVEKKVDLEATIHAGDIITVKQRFF